MLQEMTGFADGMTPEITEGKVITVEEANTFLEATKKYAAHIAPAVSLCVLSPVVLLWLLGMAGAKKACHRKCCGRNRSYRTITDGGQRRFRNQRQFALPVHEVRDADGCAPSLPPG